MNEIKTLEIRPQTKLSLAKSFRFCRKGISYRLFRSSLTLAVVVVAVAFFMVLLSESVMIASIGRGVRAEVDRMREADVLLSRLFTVPPGGAFRRRVAEAYERSARIEEMTRVAGISEKRALELARECSLEQTYLRFFDKLRPAKRLVLAKNNRGREIFTYLQDDVSWQDFWKDLDQMHSVRLPTEPERLHRFVKGWDSFVNDMETVRQQWKHTVERMRDELQTLTGKKSTAEWMSKADPEQVDRWREIVTDQGFVVSPEKMVRVKQSLTLAAWEDSISRLLQMPDKSAEWKQVFHSSPPLSEKMLQLGDERVGELLDGQFTRQQRVAVMQRFERRAELRDLMRKLPPRREDPNRFFLSGQQTVIIAISFLVCMVGITNAMLMSITERFREIATMKCIGATDGFILRQFLIEAALQGVVGGVLGMVFGILIAIAKTGVIMGSSVFVFFPALSLLYCGLATVVLGVVLAMLASIYPSVAAARMTPMDAMRVE